MTLRSVSFLLLSALVFTCGCDSADPGVSSPDSLKNEFRGLVRTQGGRGIEGAIVRIGDRSATTNRFGSFVFFELDRGVYPFSAHAPGYVDHSSEVEIFDSFQVRNADLTALVSSVSVRPFFDYEQDNPTFLRVSVDATALQESIVPTSRVISVYCYDLDASGFSGAFQELTTLPLSGGSKTIGPLAEDRTASCFAAVSNVDGKHHEAKPNPSTFTLIERNGDFRIPATVLILDGNQPPNQSSILRPDLVSSLSSQVLARRNGIRIPPIEPFTGARTLFVTMRSYWMYLAGIPDPSQLQWQPLSKISFELILANTTAGQCVPSACLVLRFPFNTWIGARNEGSELVFYDGNDLDNASVIARFPAGEMVRVDFVIHQDPGTRIGLVNDATLRLFLNNSLVHEIIPARLPADTQPSFGITNFSPEYVWVENLGIWL